MKLCRIVALLLIVFLAGPLASFACSCFNGGKFTEYTEGAWVIRGTVESHGKKPVDVNLAYPTMKVSVDEVIRGEYAHKTIEFLGDYGALCLAPIRPDLYKVGSQHLFMVTAEDRQQGLQGCGESSVEIIDDRVHGVYLRENWWRRARLVRYSVAYDKFLKNLN